MYRIFSLEESAKRQMHVVHILHYLHLPTITMRMTLNSVMSRHIVLLLSTLHLAGAANGDSTFKCQPCKDANW